MMVLTSYDRERAADRNTGTHENVLGRLMRIEIDARRNTVRAWSYVRGGRLGKVLGRVWSVAERWTCVLCYLSVARMVSDSILTLNEP